jgi:hypothetical protein
MRRIVLASIVVMCIALPFAYPYLRTDKLAGIDATVLSPPTKPAPRPKKPSAYEAYAHAIDHAGDEPAADGPAKPRGPNYRDPAKALEAKALHLDPAEVKIATELAARNPRTLTPEERRILGNLQIRTKNACTERQADACVVRGDLARAGGDRTAAIEWYRRAQAHATNVTSRCDGGNERRKDRCTAAASAKQLAKEKEEAVQASFRRGH